MSASDIGLSLEVPAKHSLRMLLNEILVMDAELEALCLDYFPQVHRQFSDGMTRIRKTNLLLESADPEAIYRALKQSAGDKLSPLAHRIDWVPRHRSAEPPPPSAAPPEEASSSTNQNPPLLVPGFFIDIVEGPAKGKTVALRNTRILVGNKDEADICIMDFGVSRSVFAMNWDPLSKTFHIIDFATRNGTRVNGELITMQPLRSGDVIEIGQNTKMVFWYKPPGKR